MTEAPAATPTTLRLRNVTLIDGTGRPPDENTTVVVRQGRISLCGSFLPGGQKNDPQAR
ncbi:MAG: hypothetical protein ABIV47_17550 [Roseiflexaceae bacterium]